MAGLMAADSPDRTVPDPAQVGGAAAGSAPSDQGAGVRRRKGRRVVRTGAGDTVVPARSADDCDLGWHEGADTNDERLRRDVPPHW
jgi:hypothetical protein